MGDRNTDKTIKVPQARRTWTVEEHDDGSVTISCEWRGQSNAAATSAPFGDHKSPVHDIARLLRDLFA